MTNDQIIEEAKVMARTIENEQDAWRGSNTRKTVFFGYNSMNTEQLDEFERIRQLFSQAFRNEI